MKQSIYLHRPIYEILSCYGTLDDVVNKILKAGADGAFDIMNKPPCPSRDGASRFDVNITEQTYIDTLALYGPNSSKISIRRLIYWFVENEMYTLLGWKQVNTYSTKNNKMIKKKTDNALSELQRAMMYCDDMYNAEINSELKVICDRIISLQEKLL